MYSGIHSCCCCCFYITSHSPVCGHMTGSSHSGGAKCPRVKKTNKPNVLQEYIIDDVIHASARKMENCEFWSQPTTCQVHTCTYVSLLAPKNPDYTIAPQKEYHVYCTRGTYYYPYARETQLSYTTYTQTK